MSGSSILNVPEELKERIEQAARERKENPSSLIASALDLLLETEQLQVEEVRRRLSSRSGKTIPNERVMAWLDTWGLEEEISPPKCE
jgi:predicted transcriptional regulator